MKLLDLLTSLSKRGMAGATIEELRNEFGDDQLDDIRRLAQAALDLNETKKDGKGRGTRYYLLDTIIPQKTNGSKKVCEEDFIEGVIDVTKCTTLEKIKRVLESDHKLQYIYTFEYRKKLENQTYNRELYDFINCGVVDVEVKVANVKGKNIIISKHEKHLNNKLLIFKESDGDWAITKIFYECPERPETQTFSSQMEFEKCLRTLNQK